jgi:acetyl esterase/lipase
MMIRIKIVISAILLFTVTGKLSSNPVDAETARRVAQNFMGKSRGDSKAVSEVITERFEEQNSIYVVNLHGGGWVMVSGDDAAVPVLAYSDNGTCGIFAKRIICAACNQ